MHENNSQETLRLVNVTRYVMPLREGGSLPALADADDGFSYVLKFKGAGQREKALVAELIGGELARRLGFKVPELVFANLDEAFGRSEGDEEIQDLLKSSQGLNLALHFLSRALTFDPGASQVDEYLASRIVWFDAWITNVDRTFRNTNLLIWNKELWLIDHGASFLFHHSWENWEKQALSPFGVVKDHVLLPWATELERVDAEMKAQISRELICRVLEMVPEEWILASRDTETAAEAREVYAAFLMKRMNNSSVFVNEAKDARKALI
ncbi:aminotransferase class I and II [Algoriphagus aestuariicola]|uniref:Aminotransferase class I and II n=1 Tax=Algoriphagus aestuariicola TaxID=1852016 RepID=A0ABS3BWA4_9BACT|nr:HipA family kinase [Algoriphagus aestuariicola]MBN7803578.1 aminotransferase class I and II [Algoriphagus aestuariicola]